MSPSEPIDDGQLIDELRFRLKKVKAISDLGMSANGCDPASYKSAHFAVLDIAEEAEQILTAWYVGKQRSKSAQ